MHRDFALLVTIAGLEPAHLAEPPPQDGVSTNSTIWPRTVNINSFNVKDSLIKSQNQKSNNTMIGCKYKGKIEY